MQKEVSFVSDQSIICLIWKILDRIIFSIPGKQFLFILQFCLISFYRKEISEDVTEKLQEVADLTERFTFFAKPISSFPTSKVLYLSPSPVTPIEALTQKLYDAFPEFKNPEAYYLYHMTIAMGYDKEKESDSYQRIYGNI